MRYVVSAQGAQGKGTSIHLRFPEKPIISRGRIYAYKSMYAHSPIKVTAVLVLVPISERNAIEGSRWSI